MLEQTILKRDNYEQVLFKLEELHEVVAAMKQCNPNMTPIRTMVFDRWRTILWEGLPLIKEFLLKYGNEVNLSAKPGFAAGGIVQKKRVLYLKPKKG